MVDMVVQTGTDEPYWVRYIRRRIEQNKNFIGIVSGQTGSGKSWSALSIAQMLNPDFNVREQVIFKGKDFLVRVNRFKKKGVVIIWDEAGIDLSNRNWMSRTNKTINFVIQTFRHQNFILLFTVPYSDFIDKQTRRLFHAELKTISIDFNKNTCKLKPQLIQYNQRYGKFYYKRLRVRRKGGGVVPLDNWNVPSPSKDMIQQYEELKKEYTSKLNSEILKEWEQEEQKKEEKPDLQPEGKKNLNPTQLIVWHLMKQEKTTGEIVKLTNIPQKKVSNIKAQIRNKGYYLEKVPITIKSR